MLKTEPGITVKLLVRVRVDQLGLEELDHLVEDEGEIENARERDLQHGGKRGPVCGEYVEGERVCEGL